MNKWFKRAAGAGVLVILGLQFTNPPHDNPPVAAGHDAMAGNSPPPAVAALLKNSCYDCHSYETHWHWYSYVAPVSWWVARDVSAARTSLNFSEWPHDNAKRARKRWRHIADEVESGEMPLPGYAWIHRQARLDPQQRKLIIKWCRQEAEQP
jgi:hypothetical protein